MNALTRVFFSLTSRAPKRKKLVILDDFFPNMYQAYRVSEFKYYCETFPGTQIYSSAEKYDEFLAEYKKAFPEHTKYVHKFSSRKVFRASLFYVVFLHNAAAFLPIIEREHTPFVLNLYAGGYFAFDNPQSDSMLRRVCASPYLKHVVVSQKNIEKYLIEKKFLPAEKITYIYGAVPSFVPFSLPITKKQYFGKKKKTLDICFVANKYGKDGKAKGFDTFVKVAAAAEKKYPHMKFHDLGEFVQGKTQKKYPSNITFHGKKNFLKLNDFFESMDIILSPNIPSQDYKGAFDGFPTGSCREAGYAGVALFCTDPLQLNTQFTHKKDIVLIDPSVESCMKYLRYYSQHPNELATLARSGQKILRSVYDYSTQMKKRAAILERYL